MSKRRVVVTGMGMVSPIGLTVAESWKNLLAGKSGITRIDTFDPSNIPVQIAGLVKGFDPSQYMSPKDIKKTDAFIHFAIAAAHEAMQDANFDLNALDLNRAGVALGSGIGGIQTITNNHSKFQEGGARKVSPFFIPACIINMGAGHVSMKYGFRGPNISIATACTTGTHNIGHAARMIAYNDADVMIAGGAEMGSTELAITGFAAARALSTRNDAPQQASRPWDKDRDGFVLGEGAGILVLESYEHASARGATIYAELSGFGMSADAYHITSPDPSASGFCATMNNALKDANMAPEAIDYINAHGTSTPVGDVIEARAITQSFGEHAKQLCVSSSKSMTGHLLGAAGAIEAIFSVLAIRDQIAPPTINLDNPDEACDLNFVPHSAQERNIAAVLSNSFGFGGTNGSLIFARL